MTKNNVVSRTTSKIPKGSEDEDDDDDDSFDWGHDSEDESSSSDGDGGIDSIRSVIFHAYLNIHCKFVILLYTKD